MESSGFSMDDFSAKFNHVLWMFFAFPWVSMIFYGFPRFSLDFHDFLYGFR